ncbi:MAG: hypothetical protein HY394_04965 [Candidatus Diapherotrites archaeon]|nr:hypothetical protein [Candidatus Diapherotrites archaeon]
MKRRSVASREAVEARAWKMNRVFDLAREGKSRPEIIAETGFNPSSVDHYLSGLKRGVVPWKRGMFDNASRLRQRRVAAERMARAVAMSTNEHMTHVEIAQRLGVSEGRVSQYLLESGNRMKGQRSPTAITGQGIERGLRRVRVFEQLKNGRNAVETARILGVSVPAVVYDLKLIRKAIGGDKYDSYVAPIKRKPAKPLPELSMPQERVRAETVMPLARTALRAYGGRYWVQPEMLDEIGNDVELLSYRIAAAADREKSEASLKAYVRQRVQGAVLDAMRADLTVRLGLGAVEGRKLFSLIAKMRRGKGLEQAADEAKLDLAKARELLEAFEREQSQLPYHVVERD